MTGVLWALAVLVLALVTAAVAESKGQSGLLWFVLGLFLPLVSLLVATLLRPTAAPEPVVPSIGQATRSSAVARALHQSPSQSADELMAVVEADANDVLRQLSALEELGLASRGPSGRWSLTERGTRYLTSANTS